jgi:hypothetical protein
MWGPWMAFHFHLKRSEIVAENVELGEIVAMWDAVKPKGA